MTSRFLYKPRFMITSHHTAKMKVFYVLALLLVAANVYADSSESGSSDSSVSNDVSVSLQESDKGWNAQIQQQWQEKKAEIEGKLEDLKERIEKKSEEIKKSWEKNKDTITVNLGDIVGNANPDLLKGFKGWNWPKKDDAEISIQAEIDDLSEDDENDLNQLDVLD